MQPGTRLAAVDLGSNSFRLEIGRLDAGQVHRTEYLKETVRQGNGLDADRNLTPEAMQRGWDCLARFGERLAGFAPAQVRAVATQTLREARNRDVFLQRGSALLGFPIEVIPGQEEARLIYQGVAHLLPPSDERRLVVDIGGRSTEMVLGQRHAALAVASYRVGSVAWSMRHFADGTLDEAAFRGAEVAAQAVLADALATFGPAHWDVAYGASGTVGAVADVLQASGGAPGRIGRGALFALRAQLIGQQHVDRLRLDGLKEERRAVIGGGIAVLCAVFDLLGIEDMQVAAGALRHGVLYDLLDREHAGTDLRAEGVRALAQRFGVDAAQAERVRGVAGALLRQLAPEHPGARDLGWAAQLHEVGCRISHTDHHKHGAYILQHTDAAGFAVHGLQRLALLVLGQRGKLRKLDADLADAALAQQLLCLRLAVLLCHARREPELDGVALRSEADRFTLALPPGWAARFPQSAYLLEQETQAWARTPWSFGVLDGSGHR